MNALCGYARRFDAVRWKGTTSRRLRLARSYIYSQVKYSVLTPADAPGERGSPFRSALDERRAKVPLSRGTADGDAQTTVENIISLNEDLAPGCGRVLASP
jgi:hypothetical protein